MKPQSKPKQRRLPGLSELMKREEKETVSELQNTQRQFHTQELAVGAGRRVRNAKANAKRAQKKKSQKGPPLLKPMAPVVGPTMKTHPCFFLERDENTQNGWEGAAGFMRDTAALSNNPSLDVMFTGVPRGDSRPKDNFSNASTVQYSVSSSGAFTLSGGTASTPNWGTVGVIAGSGANTFKHSCTLTSYNPAWDTGTVVSAGLNGSDWLSRPMGYRLKLLPILVGPSHPVTICGFPIIPSEVAAFSTHPGGWPTDVSQGPTAVECSWGARQWLVQPGQTVQFCGLPLDNRGYDFCVSSTPRLNSGGLGRQAWTGWVFWAYGFMPGDQLRYSITFAEECLQITEMTTNYAYPGYMRKADPVTFAQTVNEAQDAATAGLTGYLDTGIRAVGRAVRDSFIEYWNGKFHGHAPTFDFGVTDPNTALWPPPSVFSTTTKRTPPVVEMDEMKDLTEQPVVLTPATARRPSLAPSLAPSLRKGK